MRDEQLRKLIETNDHHLCKRENLFWFLGKGVIRVKGHRDSTCQCY